MFSVIASGLVAILLAVGAPVPGPAAAQSVPVNRSTCTTCEPGSAAVKVALLPVPGHTFLDCAQLETAIVRSGHVVVKRCTPIPGAFYLLWA